MGGLPEDVLLFVKQRFARPIWQPVCSLLEAPAVATPRVLRSVLFLADGSLDRLKQYVSDCEADVRGILTSAEYVSDEAGKLIRVRDMSMPFTDEGGVGKLDAHLVVIPPIAAGPRQRAVCSKRANHHSYLVHRSFKLGQVTYLIASAQPRRDYVSCYRKSGTVVRLVKLPLMFVLEQLAERIELDATSS